MSEFIDGKIKIIAFYLPQYHSIPENDKAWGKGFTEWTNVKKAKPLFENHFQPKIPLNNNYYCLLDEKTQEWQALLANKYGIDGFCYYHYWFKNGKKLLEKPSELMLINPKIQIPFCFCWANENWTKNWDGGNRELIVEQDYGTMEEWEAHFLYFLDFFKDPRYITLNNCPLLIIYKPELIDNFYEMTRYFKKRCKEEGFNGCEIMVQYPDYLNSDKYNENSFDHYICFEPAYTLIHDSIMGKNFSLSEKIRRYLRGVLGTKISKKLSKYSDLGNKKTLKKYDYDKQWDYILKRTYKSNKFVAGAFVDWDNTSRNKNGTVYIGASPNKFEIYMKRLLKKINKQNMLPFVFINAWNEWGEGAYLEPDEKNGYGYLEAIKHARESVD